MKRRNEQEYKSEEYRGQPLHIYYYLANYNSDDSSVFLFWGFRPPTGVPEEDSIPVARREWTQAITIGTHSFHEKILLCPMKTGISYLANHKEKDDQECQKTFYGGMRFHLDLIFSWDPTSREKRQTGLCFNLRKKDS